MHANEEDNGLDYLKTKQVNKQKTLKSKVTNEIKKNCTKICFILIDDTKPPILRKLEKKSHQSEIFYNSNKSNPLVSESSNNKNANGQVSKSYNEIGNNNKNENISPLQDSLKIFRKINPVSPQVTTFNFSYFVFLFVFF